MARDYFAHVFRGVSGALCALAATVSASAQARPSAPIAEIPHTQPPVNEVERVLVAHNAERTRLGLPGLVWNASLASDASDYARHLLDKGSLQHSSAAVRKGGGENLWMGSAGAWDSAGMVDMFISERRYFRAAKFPDVSLTGNWTDVGHYSQIVWRETKEIGCALASGKGNDVLVCRYFPAGNVVGKAPF